MKNGSTVKFQFNGRFRSGVFLAVRGSMTLVKCSRSGIVKTFTTAKIRNMVETRTLTQQNENRRVVVNKNWVDRSDYADAIPASWNSVGTSHD